MDSCQKCRFYKTNKNKGVCISPESGRYNRFTKKTDICVRFRLMKYPEPKNLPGIKTEIKIETETEIKE